MSIPFSFEMIDIFWCFDLEGRCCSYPIVRFCDQRQADFFHSFINIFFCFDHGSWNNWNSCFFEEFLHFRFEFCFLQVFWFSPKDVELLPKCRIQFQPIFIVRFNAVNWTVFIKEKGHGTFDFIQIFQVFNTEILCQTLAQRFI